MQMAVRTINAGSSYPSVSWADTLDVQRSALRWDVKRAMKSLCGKLEEIGEQCFVVTVNVSNGWVGHLGTLRGDEYIDEKSHILYDFLNYCAESFHAEANREGTGDNSSDTESCTEDVNGEDDTPITISRPGINVEEDRSSTVASDKDDQIIVETPVRYIYSQPRGNLVSVEDHAEKFILMSPADLQNVTQKVLETEYQPAPPKSQSVDSGPFKDKSKGNKRKRKQSFEGVDKHGNKEPSKGYIKEFMSYWKLTPEQEPSVDTELIPTSDDKTESHRKMKASLHTLGKKYHKNKKYRDEYEDKSMPYVSNDETDMVQFTPGSSLVELEDVTESTRVLRSSSLQGRKPELEKVKEKLSSKLSGNDEDEIDHADWDDDDEDYTADDANDEDWDIEYEAREISGRINRDNLGRFLSQSHSNRRKSGRKRKKTEDSFESSSKETDGELVNEPGVGINIVESSELVHANLCHTIGSSGMLEFEMSFVDGTGKETKNLRDSESMGNEENETRKNSDYISSKGGSRSKRKKSKLTASDKEGESQMVTDLDIVSREADKEQIKEQSTEVTEKSETEKESLRRPSLKRKLKSLADEKWTIVDVSKSNKETPTVE